MSLYNPQSPIPTPDPHAKIMADHVCAEITSLSDLLLAGYSNILQYLGNVTEGTTREDILKELGADAEKLPQLAANLRQLLVTVDEKLGEKFDALTPKVGS